MAMTLTVGDILVVVGIVTGPYSLALIWAIRLEGKVRELGLSRAADLAIIEARRLSDTQLISLRQQGVDEKLATIAKHVDALPALQRSIDQMAGALGLQGWIKPQP